MNKKILKKKTPHTVQQARILREFIDKRIDSRLNRVENNVAKMYKLFKQMKDSASPKHILKLENEMETIREILDDFNVKALEEDVFSRIKEMEKKLSKSVNDDKKVVEGTEIEISELRNKIEEFDDFGKEFMELDISSLKRDIEVLKTKTEWLELEFEKVNIRPLEEMVNEIEARMDAMRLSQPTIIE